MRVLIVSIEYPPRPGGIGVSCQRLATGLREAGDEVIVITFDFDNAVELYEAEIRTTVQDGIVVHWLPSRFTSGDGFAQSINHVVPMVKKFRPSVVHSYAPVLAGYLGVRCAAFQDVPHIVSNRGADVTQFSLATPTETRLVYDNSDAILSVSSSFLPYIELISGRTDVQVVANSVSQSVYDAGIVSREAARQTLSLSQDVLTLGTISKFRWKKGLPYLEELLVQLGKSSLKDLQFVLGGIFDEETCTRLKTAFENTSSKAHSRRLITREKLTREEVPLLMSAMDLFVSTSYREGMPNTLIESLACGTPVAATAVDGQVDLLEGSEVGTLLHRFDPQIGARQIVDLLSDQKALKQMASRCRPFIANNYLQKHEVETVRGIYQEVLEKRNLSRTRPMKQAV